MCSLCDKTLDVDYILFPPFTSNTKDPMFAFSDAGVHVKCLDLNPFRDKALKLRDQHDAYLQKYRVTRDPRHVITFGMLTSDEHEDLFKFNFILLHKDEVTNWTQKNEFKRAAKRFLADGKWKSTSDFNYLDHLLEQINENDLNKNDEWTSSIYILD